MEFVELDGSQGEGGGQILRSALTLSMITGRAFRIENIRAKRAKPGLLRQHLTAVNAAAEICGARVEGAEPGSLALSFAPGRIKGGAYRYAIGTAGSCTLVLQTILPALWFADAPSTVVITGGTHNPAAPPADFLLRAWLPLVRRMGVEMDLELVRHGFYPAGGGEMRAEVSPVAALRPLDLAQRGQWLATKATAIVAGVPGQVAKRELAQLGVRLGAIEQEIRGLAAREGPGNALLVEVSYEAVSEVFTGFGEKGLRSEAVADRVAKDVRQYRDGAASVGEHLADQLVLPIALAGKGRFTTTTLSSHLQTNLEVIGRFLEVEFETGETDAVARVSLG
jgi:RNA 3'-terminal phosphate cyclase (ATP)